MIWHRLLFSPAGLLGVPASALERLARIAHGLGADVDIFDCLYDPDVTSLTNAATVNAFIQERIEERRRQVQLWADAVRARNVAVRVSVRWDYPAGEAIVRQVLHYKPDLLIVPTTRSSAAEQRFLTYTDHRLIETCPCPLLLLKAPGPHADGRVLAAVDPGHPQDPGAALDESVLGAATTMAQALHDGGVEVCHWVVPSYTAQAREAGVGASLSEHERTQEVARLMAVQDRVRTTAARHNVPGDRVHVNLGIMETALPALARELRTDVLVMGALSRTWTRRPFVTPRAEQILDALECDVLVVKPAGFRTPVARRPRGLATQPRSAAPRQEAAR